MLIKNKVVFCIEEWKTGHHIKADFKAANFREEYGQILADFNTLLSDPISKEITERHLNRLYESAR